MISLFSSASPHTSSAHRLSLCSILLLYLCFAGVFAAGSAADDEFQVQQITDDDSLRENLDSIFEGNIVAVINSTSPCIPSSYTFGPYKNARLTIGPNHRPGMDPNPYFLSFAGGEDGEFFGGMQSSITSQDVNDTYWALQAWEHNGEYEVTGTLMKSVDESSYGERNGFGGILAGKLGKDNYRDEDEDEGGNDKRSLWRRSNKECMDEPKFITWAHTADGTTLLGTVNEKEALMTLSGSITVTYQTDRKDDNEGRQRRGLQLRQNDKDEENTVQLQYTLTFSGQHNSDSAPLPQGGLVWTTPGSGTPLETFKIPRVSVEDLEDLRETTTTSTSKTRTTTSTRTTSSATSTSTSTITPTSSPIIDDDNDDDDPKSGLPKGSIIAIVLGTVLFLILLAAAFFFGRAWWERRKQPKVYPELAYIYSTPFTVRNTQKKSDPNSATRGAYGQLRDDNIDTEYRGGSAGARMSGAMTGFGKETGIRDSYYAPEDSGPYDGGTGSGQGGGGGGYMMAGGAAPATTTMVDREDGDMGVGGGRVSERVRVEEESGMRQPMLQGNSGGPPPGSRGSHGESYWSPPSSWV